MASVGQPTQATEALDFLPLPFDMLDVLPLPFDVLDILSILGGVL